VSPFAGLRLESTSSNAPPSFNNFSKSVKKALDKFYISDLIGAKVTSFKKGVPFCLATT